MILGVSEWFAKKIDVETKYVRIGFLLALVFAGTGVGLYLILWIVKTLKKE